MGEKERMDDAGFAHEILKSLPTTAVPSALEARILADFDRVAVRPGRLKAMLTRLGERLWPGAPAWQPASVLAISLVLGLTAGVFVPSLMASTASSDSVFIVSFDTTPDLDLDRDQ